MPFYAVRILRIIGKNSADFSKTVFTFHPFRGIIGQNVTEALMKEHGPVKPEDYEEPACLLCMHDDKTVRRIDA